MFHALQSRSFLLAAALLLLAGRASAAAPPAAGSPAPTLQEARGATYHGLDGDSAVTLQNGQWEGAPFVEGGALRPHVDLVRDFLVTGNLDGDRDDEAAVFLAQGLGGAERVLFAAVLDRGPDGVVNAATVRLGDQAQVRSASIAKGRLVLDLIEVAESDPRCCPGDWVTRAFTLKGGALVEALPRAKVRRLTPDALGGGAWVLRAWDVGEPLADSIEVTLELVGKVLAGDAGCNRFVVPYKDGDLPGDIRMGPVAETKYPCPEPSMSAQARFYDLLGRARRFSFVAGALYVTWENGGAYGSMVFERAAAPSPKAP